jgi:Tol biopolymer transport system component
MKKILVVLSIALIFLAIGCLSEVGELPDAYVGRPIKSISTLVNSLAKTLDWCPANNLIAFERFGVDGYVDIHVLDPENGQIRALTDGNPLCPQKSNGNSAWHPSGQYIVFTAEKPSNPVALRREAIPGSGYNCDLWLASADASAFYPLTDYPLYSRAVIHPHFSHDGNKLFWAERLGKSSGSE